MKIGYACTAKGVSYRTNRTFKIKKLSRDILYKSINSNLDDLLEIIKYNYNANILLFRISSDIIPFGSHKMNTYNWREDFGKRLSDIGKYIKNNNMRVSMHPGQYTVLNSPNKKVVENAIEDLIYHCDFLDLLRVDSTNKIILHVGGVYDNKDQSIERFINIYKSLPQNIKNRLVIENDEKNYSIDDLFKISETIQIPLIFDLLHHRINYKGNVEIAEIIKRVSNTWKIKDGLMKIHYSQQDQDKKTGTHSITINSKQFLKDWNMYFKNKHLDIMLEVKDKDISAIKCSLLLKDIQKDKKSLYDQWAKYKYLVMEKGYKEYKLMGSNIEDMKDFLSFYMKVDEIITQPFSDQNYTNTLLHVWGYVKDCASDFERKHFFNLLNDNKLLQGKKYLYKLSIKYNISYLISSYYFSNL